MNAPIFIPKDQKDIPDSYKMKISYITGAVDEIEVVQHSIIDKVSNGGEVFGVSFAPIVEYLTIKNTWGWIPISSIKRLDFDENCTKLMELAKNKVKKIEGEV